MPYNLSPIILFCYNRADKTKAVLDALKQNNSAQESELFIFCDGPRSESDLVKVKEVHKVIDSVTGFKKVVVEKRDLIKGLLILSLVESVKSLMNMGKQ